MEAETTTPSILDLLVEGKVLISDGATGTYLQQHGLEPGGCPEELNASKPDTVKGMARAYFDVGSDMVLTNSFGGNKFMLQKYGHGNRVEELNRLAAQHARSQAPPGKFVVGSVGPTGEFLEPLGDVSKTEMLEAFGAQVVALEQGGADAIIIETMTAIEETTLAIKAAKEYTKLIVMSTMVFDLGPRGFFTMMGVTPEKAVNDSLEAGAAIAGANCGNGIDVMIKLSAEMRRATDGYLLVHSNAGIPIFKNGQIIYPENPRYMARRFKNLSDLGINIIGGCCGTTPTHIQAIKSELKPKGAKQQ
ncbi:methionine synthase [SAR202 cluster bacterium AD-804-J14_MRT_500m]|nr:methionine synthase [SAR202 cluster bacterium AD-804-J14_MRT_500m]